MLEGRTEILAIPNRYKNTRKNFIDSLDIEPLIMLRPIGKKSHNIVTNLEDPLIEPKLDSPT